MIERVPAFTFEQTTMYGGAHSGAIISDDKLYRYALWRQWDASRPGCNFVLLNPSTADADNDDPTIIRLCARAKTAGFGSLAVTNAYAYRTKSPKELAKFARAGGDPVGPQNERALYAFGRNAKAVLIGWGTHVDEARPDRHKALLAFYSAAGIDVHDLGRNSDGTPKHPLYIAYNQRSAVGL